MSSPLSAAAERRAVRCHGHRSWARRALRTARSPPGGWLVRGGLPGPRHLRRGPRVAENARERANLLLQSKGRLLIPAAGAPL